MTAALSQGSEETRLLVESASRLLADRYDFHQRQAFLRAAQPGSVLACWPEFVELGWTTVGVPESLGGFGTPSDLLALVRVTGSALVLEPVLSAGFGTQLLSRCSPGDAGLLEAALAGEARVIPALGEAAGGFTLVTPSVAAAPGDGEAIQLTGTKHLVLDAPAATHFLVSAQLAGEPGERLLCSVPAGSDGAVLRSCGATDDRRLGTLELNAVPARILARGSEAAALLVLAEDLAAALHACDALGAMEVLLQQTIDYAGQRRQFGQPLGSFQALQHRMADMFMAVERSRSMFELLVSVFVGETSAQERARTVSMAKVEISDSATYVGQQAVQIHGGIGITDELAAAHYFKRLTAAAIYGGDSRYHLGRYQQLRTAAKPEGAP